MQTFCMQVGKKQLATSAKVPLMISFEDRVSDLLRIIILISPRTPFKPQSLRGPGVQKSCRQLVKSVEDSEKKLSGFSGICSLQADNLMQEGSETIESCRYPVTKQSGNRNVEILRRIGIHCQLQVYIVENALLKMHSRGFCHCR